MLVPMATWYSIFILYCYHCFIAALFKCAVIFILPWCVCASHKSVSKNYIIKQFSEFGKKK